jgi:tetratricopeptide (TPR) repeat protein
MLKVLLILLVTLNRIEALKPSSSINPAMIYGAMTSISGWLNMHGLARRYYSLTQKTIPVASNHGQKLASALLGFYHAQLAEWEKANTFISGAVAEFERVGDFHNADETNSILGRLYALQGRFDEAEELLIKSYQRALERKDSAIYFYLYLAICAQQLQRGNYTQATFDDFYFLAGSTIPGEFSSSIKLHPLNQPSFQAIRAAWLLHQSEYAQAYQLLGEIVPVLASKPVERNFIYYELYTLAVQVGLCLIRADSGLSSIEKANLLNWTRQALEKLKDFGRIFVFAAVRATLLEGYLLAAQTNNIKSGIPLWEAALTQAQTLALPHDIALGYAALNEAGQDRQESLTALASQLNLSISENRLFKMR